MARPKGQTSMKGEQDLLFQVLDEAIPVQEVQAWLDDAFEGIRGTAVDSGTSSRFKQFDPLAFVVIVLNFLREDTAPLLAPSGDRPQAGDQPSPTKDSAAGAPVNVTSKPEFRRGLFPTAGFDISSADDFPSLPLEEVPCGKGMVRGNKQKRRIRPTFLSGTEKNVKGEFAAFGATGGISSSFGRTGEAAPTQVQVCAQDLSTPLQSAQTPQIAALDREEVESTAVPIPSGNPVVKTRLSTNPAEEHVVAEGLGESESGITYLREATSGFMPEHAQRARRTYLLQGDEVEGACKASRRQSCTSSLLSTGYEAGSSDVATRTDMLDPDGAKGQQNLFSDNHAASRLVHSKDQTDVEPLLWTPKRPAAAGFTPRSGGGVSSSSSCAPSAMPVMTPTEPASNTAEKEGRRRDEQSLSILASLYVHIMLRRFVPSLATEMHLTIRLLHVHSDVARSCGGKTSTLEHDRQESPPSSSLTVDSIVDRVARKESLDNSGGKSETKVVFRTGMDCRSFAVQVLRGLKSLLPHLGTDTLDLLAGSLALASQAEEVIEEVNACKGNTGGKGPRKKRQQNADDTAIVQSVGAPFAALQWREEDSVNNFRTISDRTLFQNRQESVDRFGALLRDYQASKKGLQQYPERALQDLRTAASALICGLAPRNYGWLAQYFLSQLVGWGLSPPEETDSEVMALVAPAGDKGRATLQKLHRRISTPSSGEHGNALKSSQKLRHPGAVSREGHAPQDRGMYVVGSTRGQKAGVQQPRSRKCSTGPRHGKGEISLTVRVPTVPLQLGWFPGNQEFFYHVLLVLDSYTFNSHLKVEFGAEITRLYYQQDIIEIEGKGVGYINDVGGTSDRSNSAAGQGIRGFTGTMVKLKVLAKFLGLLTFCPNWGISVPDAVSTTPELNARTATCPLPLEAYLNHAWSTAGLVGAVPWMADFLRMMKWDEVSSQASYYRRILGTLAKLHAKPCMRPEHPAFTESLFAVSCEIESLFQDLGSDLGVHGYHFSSQANESVVDFNSQGRRENVSLANKSETRSGSLDEEVVLTRRLIQNCCPYLEDVLTLIRSLGRAWKLGMIAGGSSTPFRAGQSPRLIGASGMSPRSRRVIKPHPLKPMRVLPSLPEQASRGGSAGEKAETGRGSVHTENTRLRLVEAFFHHLPGELQEIADFVVRHAVQNACEEVLADVIRPEIAAAVNRLQLALNEVDRMDHAPPAPSSVGKTSTAAVANLGRGEMTRQSVDPLVAWMTAAIEDTLESDARSLAGKRGKAVAVTTAMALVPHSLSLRVRRMAAAIAGHHAQHAAEKKIGELTTAMILDTVNAYSSNHEEVQAFLAQSQSIEQGAGSWRQDNQLPKAPAPSELCVFASFLLEAADDLLPTSTKSDFMDAVRRVSITSANDAQAVKSVVRGTLHLVQEIGRFRRSRGIPGKTNDSADAADEEGGLQNAMSPKRARENPNILGKFLTSLARFYGALPDHQHDVWQSVRTSIMQSQGSGDVFGELFQLAAIEWERSTLRGGQLVEDHDENLRKDGPAQDRCFRLPPWDSLLKFLSWGLVSIVTAENVLLSCLQNASIVPSSGLDRGVMHLSECWQATKWPSKESLIAVATAVATGYHSLGSGELLSTVMLPDLLYVANNSAPAVIAAVKPFRYHPMHLCRLVACLRARKESVPG